MDAQQDFGSDERAVDDGDPDYWGMILDTIPPVLRAWKFIVISTLAAGAIAYFAGAFNVSHVKTYSSFAYIGPLDEATAKYANSILRSGPVLASVLDKFPDYPARDVPAARRHEYLQNHLQLSPAAMSDSKQSSRVAASNPERLLYVLQVSDTDPSRARALASLLIDTWLATTKPQPGAVARLDRLLEARQTQISDVSTLIDQILKHPELIVPKPGNASPDVARLIELRVDSISGAEDIKKELAGLGKDIVVLPPTLPDKSAPDVIENSPRRTALKTIGVTFAGLVLIVVLIHFVEMAMRSPVYGPRMLRIRDALPWRTARKEVL